MYQTKSSRLPTTMIIYATISSDTILRCLTITKEDGSPFLKRRREIGRQRVNSWVGHMHIALVISFASLLGMVGQMPFLLSGVIALSNGNEISVTKKKIGKDRLGESGRIRCLTSDDPEI